MTDEQILHSIETNELTLTNWEKFTHYGVVIYLMLIPTLHIIFDLNKLSDGIYNDNSRGFTLFTFASLFLGIMFYFVQRNRLKFKIVSTTLTRSEIDNIIQRVAKELKWTIYTNNNKIVQAKTFPSFLSGSWGEQITIIFDKESILINSICDPDKHSSVISMGRNRNNTQKLISEITHASRLHGVLRQRG